MRAVLLWSLCFAGLCGAQRPSFCPAEPAVGAPGEWSNRLGGRPTIVVSAPKLSEPYYRDFWDTIVRFQISYARAVVDNPSVERDNFLLAADGATLERIKTLLPADYHDILIRSDIDDIWMRDFSPINMPEQVEFKYAADYIPSQSDRDIIQGTFRSFLASYGAAPFATSQRKLDGGNVVDNFEAGPAGMAVVTTRYCTDNGLACATEPQREAVRAELRGLLKYANVALVPDQGDTTGHSDGIVTFLGPQTLGYMRPATEAEHTALRAELTAQLPGVFLVELDSHYTGGTWRTFTSACGIHVNALSTYNNFYVPVFGGDAENRAGGQSAAIDARVLRAVRENTCHTVVPVEVPHKVCRMGGSVRCLSYQVDGENADRLVAAARANVA